MSTRKRLLVLLGLAVAALLLALLGRPALHLARTAWSDEDRRVPSRRGTSTTRAG